MLNGLITALRTLSILPVPGKDAASFAASLGWFPLVGTVIGLPLCAMGLYLGDHWSAGTAMLMVTTSVVLTRGLHLDGLADCVDGFGSGAKRERVLEIMKDPCVGAFGAIALVLVLAAKGVAFERIIRLNREWHVVAAYALSRAMQVELAVCLPYARKTGTAAAFVQGAKPRHRVVALAMGLLLAVLACGGLWGVVLFVAVWLLARLFGLWCLKRVGGVTGDLLGTCSEITETAALLLVAVG